MTTLASNHSEDKGTSERARELLKEFSSTENLGSTFSDQGSLNVYLPSRRETAPPDWNFIEELRVLAQNHIAELLISESLVDLISEIWPSEEDDEMVLDYSQLGMIAREPPPPGIDWSVGPEYTFSELFDVAEDRDG